MSTTKHVAAVAVVLTTMFGTAIPAFADTMNATTESNVTTTNGTSGNDVGNTTNGTGSTSPVAYPAIYLAFVTQVTQSISIALASNDTDKAKLLVQFGIDNINKANELIAEGNTDAATTLLTSALSQQDLAVDAGSQSGDTTATEVKGAVAGNLEALAHALQHVSNPRAQAALRKNIEKGLEHLQKKIGKIAVVQTSSSDGQSGSDGTTTGSTPTTSTGSDTTGNTTDTTNGTPAGSVNVTVGSNTTVDPGSVPTVPSNHGQGNGNGHGSGSGQGQGNGNGQGHGHH